MDLEIFCMKTIFRPTCSFCGTQIFFTFHTHICCFYNTFPCLSIRLSKCIGCVAGDGYPLLPVHAAARGTGLGEHGLRPLGPGGRLVQQRGLEHRPAHLPPVPSRHREIRVEQEPALPIHRCNGMVKTCPGI